MPLSIVILAAGQGTRMHSNLPKVLQPLAGRPMLAHVLETCAQLNANETHVVIGHGAEAVRETFADHDIRWVEQAKQLGTGHAVAQALPAISDKNTALVLYGDVPLVRAETLQTLIKAAGPAGLAVLTASLEDPAGYGRIVRDSKGRVTKIIEEKDATKAERAISEINTGLIACRAHFLKTWIAKLSDDNAQGEYYLTDIIGMAVKDGVAVHTSQPDSVVETLGINDRRQLAQVEAALRQRNANALLDAGVTLVDPLRVDVRGRLECGHDVTIDINVVFEGNVKLDDNVSIGPNCYIRDSQIEQDCQVLPNTLIDSAHIGPRSQIGPFARLRPETFVGSEVKVGNFVEVKKSAIGKGSKVSHLSYIGDAKIGKDVNVGAGTITCNYDGVNKHRTVIGDNVFVGSGTNLVAPVKVGADATIGAGSTITKDAPEGELTVARVRQSSVKGWKKPEKKAK
ncbi:MAG: bifunctional UDP-N-acetylglucosamine diphosphorylase/glucosamine-1-phosphate N-acetyltransferase GlmU [Gammaproteobacteria bacterium]|nr:bifunctional UDP-N-acetylglucosamine diphosphorylase/glucosamine-1-phosphate N-acetyltransferase GlmU [Gammaproteobacteria bacterium]MDH3766815.1 bifunctional UDP-N-acetylglucosamine diphosphorylase/glucosamine-1-phosphate N-acetyltransferase GlmU [Gammaproteobacteria bacterium]